MHWSNTTIIKSLRFIALIIIVSVLSCKKDIPNDGIPAYVHVDQTTVLADPDLGSNSHNITDVWVQVDGQDLGVYELPVTFPVLKEGVHTLIIQAGIQDNGIAATRAIYPFYRLDSVTVNLEKTKTVTVQPEFTYAKSTKVALNEDFELGNTFDDMSRTTKSSQVFEGSGSGLIELDDLNPVVEAKTSNPIIIPLGASTYIELNYRTNNFFTIRIQGVQNSGQTLTIEKIFVAPQETWNKIYVNISNDIGNLNADQYNFIIAATKSDTLIEAEILIDNFKVIHF